MPDLIAIGYDDAHTLTAGGNGRCQTGGPAADHENIGFSHEPSHVHRATREA